MLLFVYVIQQLNINFNFNTNANHGDQHWSNVTGGCQIHSLDNDALNSKFFVMRLNMLMGDGVKES